MHIKKIIINKLKSLFSNDNLMYTSQLSTHNHICEHCYKTFLENNDLYTLYKTICNYNSLCVKIQQYSP